MTSQGKTSSKVASAGNSGEGVRSDCLVRLELKRSRGLVLRLESKVEKIFGKQIRTQAETVLGELGITHAEVEILDSGALPFVIAARLEAAASQLRADCPAVLPELLPQNRYESERERGRFTRLYLPGNRPSMMLNAGLHRPEGIILDLEDSVAPEKKTEARLLVRNALAQVDFMGAERMVRINQLPGGLEDLPYVVPFNLHLVLIPKCESAQQVRAVNDRIREILGECGQERELFLMPIIESCLGVERAFEIAASCEQVVAMAIGLEDYTADLGVPRSRSGEESLYARTRLVNACRAAGIQAIDSVFSDVADMEGLAATAIRSRALGFEGMGCIHPGQIDTIRRAYLPTREEAEKAEEVVKAFREASSRGLGVVALGSKMIDPPVVKRALRVVKLAGLYGTGNQGKGS
jgi:citrate lyase subunit beta/citryl-CoA lyase